MDQLMANHAFDRTPESMVALRDRHLGGAGQGGRYVFQEEKGDERKKGTEGLKFNPSEVPPIKRTI